MNRIVRVNCECALYECNLCGGLAGKEASRWRYKDGSIHVVCEKCLEAEPEKNFERGLDWIFERIQEAAKKR